MSEIPHSSGNIGTLMVEETQNKQNYKLLVLAAIVGFVVGGFGAVFRLLLDWISKFRINLYANMGVDGISAWVYAIAFAAISIMISLYLVKKYAPESSGSGVQDIEGALDGLRSLRWKWVLPIKFVASLFSIGSGFLLGREGPTIQIGANIGKMIKDIFKDPDFDNNPLVSAGAAAGLASAFNAPLAGIVFVIEEMHDHFKFNFYSVSAIMLASGIGDIMVRLIVSDSPVIDMSVYKLHYMSDIWFFIIFGVIISFVGYAFNKLLIKSLDTFSQVFKNKLIISALIAGATIAIVGYFFPNMIGGGYDTISAVIGDSFSLQFLIVLFFGRFILVLLSYGTGVPGGIFAPLLSIGVVLGMAFGLLMQYYFPETIQHPGVFAVAGMAGIFAATVRAPLTGLVLAIEMTSNFELILPLIFTTLTASFLTTQMGNKPIYNTLLKRTLDREAAEGKIIDYEN